MAGPSVNVVLRLDSSKVKEDAEKAKSILTTSINPTVDVFNVATKAVEIFGKSLEVAGKGLVFMTERTGAMQALVETLGDTRKAIGEAADRSGALRTATEAIEQAARSVSSFMRSDEGRQAINGFFAAISSGAAAALDALNGLMKAGGSIAKMFLGDAPKGTRAAAIVEGLSGPGPQGETPLQALLTQVADMLRAGGDTSRAGSGVRDRGTFRDDEAIKAAKDRAEAEAKAMDAAVARIDVEIKAGEALIKAGKELAKAEEEERRKKFLADMAALNHQRNIAELARTVEEGKTEIAVRNAERRAEIAEREQQAIAQQTADMRAELDSQIGIASSIAAAVSDTMTQIISAAATDIDLGAVVARIMGGYIASLGASAIAAGTLAVALGTLGLFVPAIGAAFPAAAIPLGFAAIGAGALAVGGGAYIQSLANGGSASSSGRGSAPSVGGGAAARRTGFSGTPEGFAGASLAPVTTILNYNFNGPMGGSPRRIAREIRDLSTAGDTLLPGYRSPGGR